MTTAAIVFAVSNFDAKQLCKLSSVEKDATKISDKFKNIGMEVIQTPSGTFAGIETVVNQLKPRAEFDMLCLYISTHGHLDTKTKKTYVVPSDAKYKKASTNSTKTVIDLSSLISSQQLLDSLTVVRSKRYLVILDICRAGGFGRLKTSDSTVPVTQKALFGNAQGTVILAAATIDEDASLDEDGSTFTNFIMQSIDNCPSSNNNIFLLPFVEHLHKSMQGNAQTPIFKCDNVSNVHLWRIGTIQAKIEIPSATSTITAIADFPLSPLSPTSTPAISSIAITTNPTPLSPPISASSSSTTTSGAPAASKKRKRQASNSDNESDKKHRASTNATCIKCGKNNLAIRKSRSENNPGKIVSINDDSF
jgi:hypothetical protein